MGKLPGLEVNYVSKVRATVARGEADAQMCMRQVETAEAKGVQMSAPGADPLAAIRHCDGYELCGCGASDDGHCMYCLQDIVAHETVSREDIEEIHRRLQRTAADRRKWDTRESALRALVAQWREAARVAEPENDGYGVAMDECADAVERLLSGPQP